MTAPSSTTLTPSATFPLSGTGSAYLADSASHWRHREQLLREASCVFLVTGILAEGAEVVVEQREGDKRIRLFSI